MFIPISVSGYITPLPTFLNSLSINLTTIVTLSRVTPAFDYAIYSYT